MIHSLMNAVVTAGDQLGLVDARDGLWLGYSLTPVVVNREPVTAMADWFLAVSMKELVFD